ncbi:hypothetical protein EV385_3824 [Krasilnikovia cinnamomea]|uniref:Uncharacterized protein n=1 Tax=Krasilnikovia cinnamomea TaxID=349313 RepID=A0A4Q7ZMX3_9ACTN|nr:hypothetical protein [Krasilnikovia cinnamomea]RZU51984.1 hypothetical protein EV385_3824 [Krasilnikovia cinnamomea]
MAFRTWARLLPVTLGMAALAAAGQLGLAYGLGIVQLAQVLDVTARDQWTAQLAWVAWFAMNAAVAGAIAGTRWLARARPAAWQALVPPAASGRAPDAPPESGNRADVPRAGEPPAPGPGAVIALALVAGLGAAVVVALTMQPARAARVTGVDPDVVIGICAGLGAVVGVLAACAALARVVARWSFAAAGAVVWLVALVSVAPSLAPGRPLSTVRLGVFEPSWLPERMVPHTALVTMPVLALLVGLGVGWAARRTGRPTLAIALAGLPGAALLTVAYLIAGPGTTSEQTAPYWAAMTAAGAGVLGSVLAAVLRRGPLTESDDPDADRPGRSADADTAPPDAGRVASPDAGRAASPDAGRAASPDAGRAAPPDAGRAAPPTAAPPTSSDAGAPVEAPTGQATGRKRTRRPADPGPAAPATPGQRANFADAFRPRPRQPEPPSARTDADPEPTPFNGFAASAAGSTTGGGGAPRHRLPEPAQDEEREPRPDRRQRRFGRSKAKDTTPPRAQDTIPAQAKGGSGSRAKDSNDYVDWVSGLSTD